MLLSSMMTCAWAYGQPKREFRSAWIATVWGLDWPSQGAGPTRTTRTLSVMHDR